MNVEGIDLSKKVLVTNAAEFIAGWIVRHLLDIGLDVVAVVDRNIAPDAIGHLETLAQGLSGNLEVHQLDFEDQNSFERAMEGCSIVFHTSTPFIAKHKDPYLDMVQPITQAAQCVFNAVNNTKSVKRVVFTSSCQTMYGDNADFQDAPGGMFGDGMWNTTSTLKYQSYGYAKTQGEKLAWKMAGEQEQWDLVTLNPGLVIGPSLTGTCNSEAHRIIALLASGKLRWGVPGFSIGVVDVRDVAEAHLYAGLKPEASGRYIIFSMPASLLDLCSMLHEEFGDRYQFAHRELPKLLTAAIGLYIHDFLSPKMVFRNIGYPWKADNSRSICELGVRYRDVEESLFEMFSQLEEKGLIKR